MNQLPPLCLFVLSPLWAVAEEMTQPSLKAEEYLAYLKEAGIIGEQDGDTEAVIEFLRDLPKDLPLRAGMTQEEVLHLVQTNNQHIKQLEKAEDRKLRPPIFADRSRHLYLFALDEVRDESISYWVNGRHQFWIDMAMADNKVANIWIVPGNASCIFPALRFDGSGPHKGRWANDPELDKFRKTVTLEAQKK